MGTATLAGRRKARQTPEEQMVDQHVGSRVRLRRKLLGMSQTNLADALGVAFQQVQKYERGTNRISASVLYETARVLGVPVEYFFDGIADRAVGTPTLSDVPHNAETIRLISTFDRIADPAVRKDLLELAKALSASR